MSHLTYWLSAFHMPGVTPIKFFTWLEHFPNIEKLFQASTEELAMVGMSLQQIDALRNPDSSLIEKDLTWDAAAEHHHLISFDDISYPSLLKKIPDPPLILYVCGNKENLSSEQIAIVGSRRASAMGLQNAELFASHLAQAGFTITSGLALGIDGAGHRAALAVRGRTIGVAGTGLSHVYPRSHRSLVEDIIRSQGTIISEFPLDTLPEAWNFPRRNRIIGGLSVGVLIIEAALKSGSLITARLAAEQGREVFAIPGSIHNPQSKGCHYLIKQGAKLVETAEDILEELKGMRPMFSPIKSTSFGLNSECARVFEHIGHEITPIDVIICHSGLTASELSSILLTLELNGYIRPIAGGYVRVVNTVGHQ